MPTPSTASTRRPSRAATPAAGETPIARRPPRARPASPPDASTTPVSPDERDRWIEVAAYYIAQRRGFAEGSPIDDWLEAEREFERLLALCRPVD